MGFKLVMNILPIFLFFSSASASRELLAASVFDVTSAKYGAKPNSDITQVIKHNLHVQLSSIILNCGFYFSSYEYRL